MKNRDGYLVFFDHNKEVMLPVALYDGTASTFARWIKAHYPGLNKGEMSDVPPFDLRAAAATVSALMLVDEIDAVLRDPQPPLRRNRNKVYPTADTPEEKLRRIETLMRQHRSRSTDPTMTLRR